MRRHEAELPGFPTIQGIISSKSASNPSSTKPNEREKEKEEEDKEEKDEAFRFHVSQRSYLQVTLTTPEPLQTASQNHDM